MGDMADLDRYRAEDLEQQFISRHGMGALAAYEAGLIDENGNDLDQFDVAGIDFTPNVPEAPPVKAPDPMRPEAKNGRYYLPHPDTGKIQGWRRMTNFCKPFEDTYHLELWKQRNVILGVMRLIQDKRIDVNATAKLHVKQDKKRLDAMATTAQDVAEAYKLSDEGTALHKSSELANHAGGDLSVVPVHHQTKIRMYLDALAVNGLCIAPGMIERVTVSVRYGAAGKFDLILQLPDGSYVIADLKTGDNLDRSMPGIATQLEGYADGVNEHGIFDGHRYDTSIKVRTDFGLVIYLPSTRDEVSVIKVDLNQGRRINKVNVDIFEARKIRVQHVSAPFRPSEYGVNQDAQEAHWIEQLNAAWTYEQLVDIARRAKSWGQWNERLSSLARNLTAEITMSQEAMGS